MRSNLPGSEPSLAIVIPVYNEADNILKALELIDLHTPVKASVYVVADSPEDNTFGVLGGFEAEKILVKPVINDYGPGALNAIKWGLQKSTESAVLVTMADLSDDMRSLPWMWDEFLQGRQVVCGSRYMKGGRQIGGPWLKGLLSRVAGLSLHYLTGLPTKDVTNSFKLYSREVVEAIELESGGGFEVGMEIVVKAWSMGFDVSEVPSVWYDRTEGDSRFRLVSWLPSYLRWYFFCLSWAWFKKRGNKA